MTAVRREHGKGEGSGALRGSAEPAIDRRARCLCVAVCASVCVCMRVCAPGSGTNGENTACVCVKVCSGARARLMLSRKNPRSKSVESEERTVQ